MPCAPEEAQALAPSSARLWVHLHRISQLSSAGRDCEQSWMEQDEEGDASAGRPQKLIRTNQTPQVARQEFSEPR